LDSVLIKIREIYVPFLLVSIGTILFYTLFRWALDIKLGFFPFDQEILNFWIPFCCPWVPILIWLKRRIRVLNVRGKNDKGYFFYEFAMVAAIAAPLIISQGYIEKASFGLVRISSIEHVSDYESEKYFKLDLFDVEKNKCLPYLSTKTTGKYNDRLNFTMSLSCPFKRDMGNVWYGIDYREHLSNKISNEKKESELKKFLKKSQESFNTYDFQNVTYFEKLRNSNERNGFIGAIKKSDSKVNEKQQIILIPQADIFEKRYNKDFTWIFISFAIGAFIILLMIVIPTINERELRSLNVSH